MKITFPECQIELTANEAITMYDYFHMKDSGVQLLKEIDRYRDMLGSVDERPKNTYHKPQEEEGLKPDDFRPAVNEGDKDFSIEEFFTPEPEAEEGENQEEGFPIGGFEIEPGEEPAREGEAVIQHAEKKELMAKLKVMKEEKPKEPKKIKGGIKHQRPIDVQMSDGNWVTFMSCSAALRALGINIKGHGSLWYALQHNTPFRGRKVRYHVEGENQQSDLDACLAEIEARNKEPYQPSRKIE